MLSKNMFSQKERNPKTDLFQDSKRSFTLLLDSVTSYASNATCRLLKIRVARVIYWKK